MNKAIWDGETIAVGNVTSGPITLYDGKNVHSLEYQLTGDGTLTLTTYVSVSGSKWHKVADVAIGLLKNSGDDGDGKGLIPLTLYAGNSFKVKATVTNDSIVLTLWFEQK